VGALTVLEVVALGMLLTRPFKTGNKFSMDAAVFLRQIRDLVLSRPSHPPYVSLLIGLLISLSCAVPLALTLRQRMQYWSQNLTFITLTKWGNLQILIPLAGTNVGVWLFIASGLEIFGFSTVLSYLVSLLLTAAISSVVWSQISIFLGRRRVRSMWTNFQNFPSKR
jgi:hypothetical protein